MTRVDRIARRSSGSGDEVVLLQLWAATRSSADMEQGAGFGGCGATILQHKPWAVRVLPKRALGYFGCSWHSLTVARRARPKPRLLDTRCNTVSMQHYAAGPQHSTNNGGEAWLPGLPMNNLSASQLLVPNKLATILPRAHTAEAPSKPAPRACNTHPPPSHRGK
jgi:hypothetical protein